jgi:HAD superfamily hydrolase (TIGR01509 family)
MPTPPHLPTLRAPRAILFDLDGTLVDTVGVRVEAWLETFTTQGIHLEASFLAPLIGSDGRLLARTGAEHAGVTLAPGGDADIDRLAGERFSALNRHPRRLPGASETLARLDAAAIPWAVATSSRPDEALASMASLDLAGEPIVVDGSDVEHAKPAPDLLLKGAHRLGVAPTEAWYVGDSRWDMLAAVAAEMTAIGVATGATSEADLATAGASRTFADLSDFLTYLDAAVLPALG